MNNIYLKNGVVAALVLGIFTLIPFIGQAQVMDANGYIDAPSDGEIDLSGIGDYYNVLNQPDNAPDPGGETGNGDPGNGVPVDGGLSFLLAAGLGYGANRIRKNRMEKRKAK